METTRSDEDHYVTATGQFIMGNEQGKMESLVVCGNFDCANFDCTGLRLMLLQPLFVVPFVA